MHFAKTDVPVGPDANCRRADEVGVNRGDWVDQNDLVVETTSAHEGIEE